MTEPLFDELIPSPITYPETGTLVCEFAAFGTPAPKGSMKGFVDNRGHARVIPDNKPALKSWHREMVDAAREAMGGREPVDEPVEVRATFCFALPAAAPKSWRTHPHWRRPKRKPDVDKTGRALLDALRNVVLVDDARVVRLVVEKRYVGDPLALDEPGVAVEVRHA